MRGDYFPWVGVIEHIKRTLLRGNPHLMARPDISGVRVTWNDADSMTLPYRYGSGQINRSISAFDSTIHSASSSEDCNSSGLPG